MGAVQVKVDIKQGGVKKAGPALLDPAYVIIFRIRVNA